MYRKVDRNFFKEWTLEMAYVLGFFAADGSMVAGSRGNHYISFHSTDRQLLVAIRGVLGSNHKIAIHKKAENGSTRNWKPAYQVQIGSREMFEDLLKLGMTPNKTSRLKFPDVPVRFLSDFVRGYFDGDGSVSVHTYQKSDRVHPSTVLLTRFACGSEQFLASMKERLHERARLRGGSLKYFGGAWRLGYSVRDSLRLYDFMYNSPAGGLFLNRKKKVFERFMEQRR